MRRSSRNKGKNVNYKDLTESEVKTGAKKPTIRRGKKFQANIPQYRGTYTQRVMHKANTQAIRKHHNFEQNLRKELHSNKLNVLGDSDLLAKILGSGKLSIKDVMSATSASKALLHAGLASKTRQRAYALHMRQGDGHKYVENMRGDAYDRQELPWGHTPKHLGIDYADIYTDSKFSHGKMAYSKKQKDENKAMKNSIQTNIDKKMKARKDRAKFIRDMPLSAMLEQLKHIDDIG